MTPQNIATRLANLKNKAKTHASNARIYNVYERRDASDELKTEMQDLNNQLTEMYVRLDDILADKHKTPFSTDQWFEALLDKRHFTEPNPRLVYEEEQILLHLEKEEEQKKLQLQREKEQRRLQLLKEEEQRKLRLQKEEEQRRLQLIEEQQRKLQLQKEEEERNLHLQRIEDYKETCKNGPDSIGKINDLINNGFDIQKDGRIYDIRTLTRMGRSVKFIAFLVNSGLKINEQDKLYFENLKKTEIEKERLNEFINLCRYGPDNTDAVSKLIKDGLIIENQDFNFSISTLVQHGRSLKFIRFLVDSGLKINEEDKLNLENLEKAEIENERNRLIEENKINQLIKITEGRFKAFDKLFEVGDINDVTTVLKAKIYNVNKGVKITGTKEIKSLLSIFVRRNTEFVKVLVESEYRVTKGEIEFFHRNSSGNVEFTKIFKILKNAPKKESNAYVYLEKLQQKRIIRILIGVIILIGLIALVYFFWEKILALFFVILIIGVFIWGIANKR